MLNAITPQIVIVNTSVSVWHAFFHYDKLLQKVQSLQTNPTCAAYYVKGREGEKPRLSAFSISVLFPAPLVRAALSLSVSVPTESYWTWNFTTLWGAVHMMSMWAGSLFTESLMIPVQGNPFGSPMTPLSLPRGYFHPLLEQGELQICFDSLNPSSLP